jgi:uncharacterized protein YcaQ
MPNRQQEQISFTWDQVTAFRLARHHLLERAPARSLTTVVRDMAGAQAQLLSAAQLSLWPRVRDLKLAQVEDAMHKRKLVKASCMRQTLFLVPSKDLAIFVRGSARRAEKEIHWMRRQGVPDSAIDAVIDAALSILDEPLTRPEIAERVSRKLGVQVQSFTGGGWGNQKKLAAVPVGQLTLPVVYLLHLARARGVVCYGPSRGSEPTFVRGDAWIPKWHDVTREEAEEHLLRIYLKAYGPATAADFAMWSGVTVTDAREIWERVGSEIVPVDVDGWAAAVLRKDLPELAQAVFKRPLVRLLPYFDSFLIGHRERRHLVTMEHHKKIYRAQGWISPVVLVNGRVAAVWEYAWEGKRIRVKVTKLEPMALRIVNVIREQVRDLARFLGAADVKVEIV